MLSCIHPKYTPAVLAVLVRYVGMQILEWIVYQQSAANGAANSGMLEGIALLCIVAVLAVWSIVAGVGHLRKTTPDIAPGVVNLVIGIILLKESLGMFGF